MSYQNLYKSYLACNLKSSVQKILDPKKRIKNNIQVQFLNLNKMCDRTFVEFWHVKLGPKTPKS